MAHFAYSVFIPILVFVIGAQVMKIYAKHNDVAAATKNLDHGKFRRGALNQRLAGYTLTDAKKVWDVIESVDNGRDAETLYLKTDLFFPWFMELDLPSAYLLPFGHSAGKFIR